MLGKALLFIFAGFVVQKFLNPVVFKLLKEHNLTGINYQGEKIITGAGLAIYSNILLVLMLILFLSHELIVPLLIFLLSSTLIIMVGFLDDLWGDSSIKGFSGHIQAMSKGQLTTGSIKALMGLVVSMFSSYYYSDNLTQFIINTLLLALTINTLNLMDLRPGRAVKFFLMAALILLFGYGLKQESQWLLLVMGALLAYISNDLKGEVMLGDAGSNLLGFILGFYVVLVADFVTKIICLFFLVLLHWYGEKHSLTKFIARVKILNYLDSLGRPET